MLAKFYSSFRVFSLCVARNIGALWIVRGHNVNSIVRRGHSCFSVDIPLNSDQYQHWFIRVFFHLIFSSHFQVCDTLFMFNVTHSITQRSRSVLSAVESNWIRAHRVGQSNKNWTEFTCQANSRNERARAKLMRCAMKIEIWMRQPSRSTQQIGLLLSLGARFCYCCCLFSWCFVVVVLLFFIQSSYTKWSLRQNDPNKMRPTLW